MTTPTPSPADELAAAIEQSRMNATTPGYQLGKIYVKEIPPDDKCASMTGLSIATAVRLLAVLRAGEAEIEAWRLWAGLDGRKDMDDVRAARAAYDAAKENP